MEISILTVITSPLLQMPAHPSGWPIAPIGLRATSDHLQLLQEVPDTNHPMCFGWITAYQDWQGMRCHQSISHRSATTAH